MAKPPISPGPLTEREAIAMVLKSLRKAADLTQEEAAERAGVAVQSWRRYEWAERDLPLDKLAKLAAALGSDLQVVLDATRNLREEGAPPTSNAARPQPRPSAPVVQFPQAPQSTLLPIRDRVQAGAWLQADDYSQAPPKSYPAARDPRYPAARQWLSEVVGDSVNLLRVHDGDLIHCVDTIDINYHPRTGDLVEVERLRFGGQERELTVKQVEVTPEGEILLWPRSSNPKWSEPIQATLHAENDQEIEVRIRGLVIASIQRFG